MEEFDINRVKLLLLAFLIFALSSFVGSAATYTVAPDGTGNYATIQAAVSNAVSGDVIIVQPGTYLENIKINKRTTSTNHDNLVLMSASGNPADTTIVANDTTSDVIYVGYMKNVTIKGFTLSGGKSGVSLTVSSGCTVTDNIFSNDATGVSLASSTANVVRNNIVTKTNSAGTGRGISLDGSGNSVISNNKISNQGIGIYVGTSGGSTLAGNSITDSSSHGIQLFRTGNCILDGNTVESTKIFGIYITEVGGNTVKNNVVSRSDNGINLVFSSGNTIVSNTANLANHSIFLNNSHNNNIQSNTVSDSGYGVAMRFSNNNSVVNNNAYNDTAGFFFTYYDSSNTISGNKANTNTNGIILTNGASNNIVDRNEANLNTRSGIALDNSSTTNNKISNNSVSQNSRGIYLSSTSGNMLSSNTFNSNSGNGIILENARNNNLISNIVNSNGNYGIYLFNSNSSSVISNTVMSNNGKGIYVLNSSQNTLSKNIASYNANQEIMLSNSDNNTISWNTAANGPVGVALDSSTYNNVSGNTIQYNSDEGIFMCPRSYNNLVYNNRFNNIQNANIRNTRSSFSIEKARGKNIMGGPYVGGNFWGSTTGTGFSETTLNDTDGDWVIDSVYSVTNFTDRYPLLDYPDILPVASFSANVNSGSAPLTVQFTDSSQYATGWSWDFESDGFTDSADKSPVHTYSIPGTYNAMLTASNENGTALATQQIIVQGILPVADFSASATSGNAPLTVQFTDLSQNAVAWSWNFGDGSTSTEKSPAHTFNSAGTYTVNLVTGNENGTSPTAKTATITVTTSSSGGGSSGSHSSSSGSSGSSGGSGGGAGSPEPAKNVKVKELCQVFITSGKAVKFDFTKNATAIVNLNFDAKKTVGKTTTIIEMLKNKSTLTPDAPEGEVYNYLNIWVGNGGYGSDEDNLENAVINFRVEKSWVQDKGIDQSSIVLNRYSDKKWNELPTTLSGEDSKYLYFKAEAPGFSPFAITGESTEKEAVTETQPETKDKEENTGSTAENTEQESENKQETSTPEKSSSAPGFEIMYGVAGLLAVFLHKRK